MSGGGFLFFRVIKLATGSFGVWCSPQFCHIVWPISYVFKNSITSNQFAWLRYEQLCTYCLNSSCIYVNWLAPVGFWVCDPGNPVSSFYSYRNWTPGGLSDFPKQVQDNSELFHSLSVFPWILLLSLGEMLFVFQHTRDLGQTAFERDAF